MDRELIKKQKYFGKIVEETMFAESHIEFVSATNVQKKVLLHFKFHIYPPVKDTTIFYLVKNHAGEIIECYSNDIGNRLISYEPLVKYETDEKYGIVIKNHKKINIYKKIIVFLINFLIFLNF